LKLINIRGVREQGWNVNHIHQGAFIMFYMVIEHFKNGDVKPVYRRFRHRGRLAPEGLYYESSWIDSLCTAVIKLWKQITVNLLMNGFPTGTIL